MNQMAPTAETLPARAARNTLTTLSADGGGIVFQTVAEARDVAYLMAGSSIAVRKHLRDNPGACFGVVIQAVEWGMSPYAVANKSYLVNDQLAYESQLIQAVILRRAPIKDRISFTYEGEGDERVCIASAETLTGKVVEYRSPKFGKITPKNSPLWKTDPDQQQSYFSGRGLCRRHFPDVLLGIYDVEELGGQPMRDVTPPQASGLASRLQGASGGFDPNVVESGLAEAQEADQPPAAADATPADETAPTAPVEHDPECMRAGEQAYADNEQREAPEDFDDAQKAAWLHGYDATAEAFAGRQ